MRDQRNVNIAHAIILLKDAPVTARLTHVVILLENALPPAGTPERRAAFEAAYAQMTEFAA